MTFYVLPPFFWMMIVCHCVFWLVFIRWSQVVVIFRNLDHHIWSVCARVQTPYMFGYSHPTLNDKNPYENNIDKAAPTWRITPLGK